MTIVQKLNEIICIISKKLAKAMRTSCKYKKYVLGRK